MAGVTPDAALLRLLELSGGSTMVITVWRFAVSGLFNLLGTLYLQGGFSPLLMGIKDAPVQLALGSVVITLTNLGFVFSLLKVDPAKALLLISLNPLWAALFGYFFLGDQLERRTVVAQIFALISITLVFVPNLLSMLGMSELLVLISEQPTSEL
ncbi:MAG: hypothetical protein SGPRY_014504, partial [Prymnesium sp.]